MSAFATLEVDGDAAARGQAHGEAFRPRIQRTCAFYLDELFAGVPLDRAALRARAETIGAIVARLAPRQADEIDGIAAGAALPAWQVHLLNARTEILNARVDECSALYFAASRVQGQTWDWVEPLEDLCVVITHTRPDGHRYVAFGEPGMVGKIGLSAAGVGVCLNILFAPHDLSGLPVHVLIGAILNAASHDEARATIDAAGRGKASHLLVGSADGRALSVEFFGDERHLLEAVDGVLLHTNHCLGRGAAGRTPALTNSCARYDDLVEQVTANPARDLARARTILSSTAGGADALLRAYRPSEVFPGQRVGSCATVLMELEHRRLHVRRGPDAAAPFQVFTL
ncbi:MAG: C45 family autoproteolytic acyltransferase/hydrolase [Gammaproteobacteria bacterium]